MDPLSGLSSGSNRFPAYKPLTLDGNCLVSKCTPNRSLCRVPGFSFSGLIDGPKTPPARPYVGATEIAWGGAPALIPSTNSKLSVVEIELGSLGIDPGVKISGPAALDRRGVRVSRWLPGVDVARVKPGGSLNVGNPGIRPECAGGSHER